MNVFCTNYITFLKENLQLWFANIGKQIETVSMNDELITIKKITQIIKVLDDVKGNLTIYVITFFHFINK